MDLVTSFQPAYLLRFLLGATRSRLLSATRRRRRRTSALTTLRCGRLGWAGLLYEGVSDDAASDSRTSVSGDLALGARSFSEIVSVGVDDDRSADDAFVSVKSDSFVLQPDFGHSGTICFHVAQITRVTMIIAIRRCSVFALVGVEMAAGGGASVGVVAKFVDVESMQTFGQPFDFARDGDGTLRRVLRQLHHAIDFFSIQDAHSFNGHFCCSKDFFGD